MPGRLVAAAGDGSPGGRLIISRTCSFMIAIAAWQACRHARLGRRKHCAYGRRRPMKYLRRFRAIGTMGGACSASLPLRHARRRAISRADAGKAGRHVIMPVVLTGNRVSVRQIAGWRTMAMTAPMAAAR